MIKLDIAGLTFSLDNRFSYLETISADYRSDREPDVTFSLTESDMAEERRLAEEPYPDRYLESAAFHRKIATVLPHYDALAFHGAVLECEGKAYLFTARSGVGKTTHISLWKKVFGDRVEILNGDKPVVRMNGEEPYIYGTPWRGKEAFGHPGGLPLAGIAFLERGVVNEALPLTKNSALSRFCSQMYIPKDPIGAKLALLTADRVLSSVPLFLLRCNMEEEAAKVAFAALVRSENESTNQSYKG